MIIDFKETPNQRLEKDVRPCSQSSPAAASSQEMSLAGAKTVSL